jgi:hypothetical protein
LREAYPRLLVFFDYLMRIKGRDGLLPVENLGVPTVWIDNAQAFKKQKHRHCAFNLYAAAMCEHALAPLTAALGLPGQARTIAATGAALRKAAIARFWSPSDGAFVNNLPWAASEGEKRFDDRSLATSVIFDQCPGGNIRTAVARLAAMPEDTGLSFPPNAIWRCWALAKAGQMETVLNDLRGRWYAMESVPENNTLAEDWHPKKDARDQWSHSPMAPLIMMHMGVAGVLPTAPGYAQCDIRPQPGSLQHFDVVTHTVRGPIRVAYAKQASGERLTLRVPAGVRARLILPRGRQVSGLPSTSGRDGTIHWLTGPIEHEGQIS